MGHVEYLSEIFDLENKAVADVGAGNGAISAQLFRAGARVTAIETDHEKAIAAIASLTSQISVMEGCAEALPLTESSQDLVCFFFSFHHVPQDVQCRAIKEAHRVLKSDGRLHVVEPFPYGSMFDVVRLVEDETQVRAHSHAVMEALGQRSSAFELLVKTEYTLTRSYPRFEDFLRQVVRVDPARNRIFEENRSAIEDRFQKVLDLSSGGHFLHQPCAAYHFRKW